MGPHEVICCFIPECTNTSQSPAGKRFARVPCLPKLRQLWIKAGLRLKIKVPVVDRSPLYCCEDHFNLQYDATKQWLMNDRHYDNGHFIKLKRGVLPHIFPSRQRPPAGGKPTKKKSVSTSELEKTVAEELKNLIKEEPEDYIEFDEEEDSNELDDSSENPVESSQAASDPNDSTDNLFKESTGSRSSTEEVKAGQDADETEGQEKTIGDGTKTDEEITVMKTNKENPKGRITKITVKEFAEIKKTGEKTSVDSDKKKDNKTEAPTNKEDKSVEVINKSSNGIQSTNGNGKKDKEVEEKGQNVENSLKRKIPEDGGAAGESSKGETVEKDGTKKKKRKVVKEILAWIPSDPSVVPQLRTPNGMQPFIVVQTPPPSTPGTAPILQLPSQPAVNGAPSVTSVPLAAGKETQFILTVPDKFPLVGPNGQQLVLAVPQGCSFSVDKLPPSNNGAVSGSKEQCTSATVGSHFLLPPSSTIPSVPSIISSCSISSTPLRSNVVSANINIDNVSNPPSTTNITGSITDHNYELPDNAEAASKLSSQKLNDTTKKQKKKPAPSGVSELGHQLSENAIAATTPIGAPTIKVAATPSAVASQPFSTCVCSASGSTKRSLIDTTELFDGSDRLSSSLQLVVEEFAAMKRAVTNLTSELQTVKAENGRLKTHNRILLEQKNAPPQPEETRKLELASEALRGVFTPNQIRILLGPRNDKGRVKWTDSEMDLAYDLNRISNQAYKYLLNDLKYPFPSITTLKRYVEKMSDENTRGGMMENHGYLAEDLGMADMSTEDDALARAILDADSEEELERDEGAIRYMEQIEKKRKLKRIMDLNFSPDSSHKDSDRTPTFRRVSVEKSSGSEVEKRIVKIDPQKKSTTGEDLVEKHKNDGPVIKHKVTRVSVPHTSAIRQLLSDEVIGQQKQIIQQNITPRVVVIPRTPYKNKNQTVDIKDPSPVVRVIDRVKKEQVATGSRDGLNDHHLLASPSSENKPGRKIMKLPAPTEKSMSSEKFLLLKQEDEFTAIQESSIHPETLSNNQILIIENPDQTSLDNNDERHIETAGELIISHDSETVAYNETHYEPSTETTHEIVGNVAEFVETDGNSKMIRIQVEPMQGEDGMLYEEVVIHCDDPAMFTETTSLTFQQDNIEGSSFL